MKKMNLRMRSTWLQCLVYLGIVLSLLSPSLAQSQSITQGPGGPILVVTAPSNPFSLYYAEILRAEGFNEFSTADIATVSSSTLSSYDVVILGEIPLTTAQVTMFTNWVNSGGSLIAMRPDKKLASLLGINDAAATLANAYLQVNQASGPGIGIVSDTIQFHGTADLYTRGSATGVATLYSDATTSTVNPAVTLNNVGTNGGQAAAFSFDLARSVIYTRQGNPAWSGQERDGLPPIRTNDLFFGAASFDPRPDWVDLNKVQIPQADEQQRLLANMILQMNKKPLPHFWYFPRNLKAVVIMTGDDHANGGTTGRFEQYKSMSSPGCSVANWECVRSTSYIYPNTPLSDTQAAAYVAQGFEVALHINTNCADWTPASLASMYTSQLGSMAAAYPSVPRPITNRTHCIAWSDYATQPQVELNNGIRLDTTYYYWPGSWIQDRPGMFTGSGMPMRFADQNGNMIDVYQASTEMTDESQQTYPLHINTLLNNALGSKGFYGAFTVNAHTDFNPSSVSDAVIPAAQSRSVPIVSSRQMLSWVDGRNSSSFGSLAWNGNILSFSIVAAAGANGLQAMLPTSARSGSLNGLTLNGSAVGYTIQQVKGIAYAVFSAAAGTYQATYTGSTTPPVISGVSASSLTFSTATISWTTDQISDSQVEYGTTTAYGTVTPLDGTMATSHNVPLSGLTAATTYHFRVKSRGIAGTTATSPDFIFTTTAPACPCSVWSANARPVNDSTPDANPVELGFRFRSDLSGFIAGIRFYKGTQNTGPHIGDLWTNTGALLATATFTSETASGWQQVSFSPAVPITANTTYVASYHTDSGFYAEDDLFFQNGGVDNPPLHALASGVDGLSGVYMYGASGFPTQTYQAANYWVDVVFALPGSGNPIPTTTSINPTSATAGGPGFTLTVNGGNFVAASTVNLNGTSRATSFISSSQLSAAIPASDIAVAGSLQVSVFNPGGGTSNVQSFTVNNPVPVTTSVSPASVNAGGGAFTLVVNGSGFVTNSVVSWSGASRSTTYVSPSQLTAAILAADIATSGNRQITVFNPGPAGGTSNAQTFSINNPLPSITGLNPNTAVAGGPAFTLTVNGTGFVNSSVVNWNGGGRSTTFISGTQLTASIPASDIASTGTAALSVSNPSPGGGTSNSQTFAVNNPVPALTSVSPTGALAGGSAFTLTVNGGNFTTGAVVRWNGANRATTVVSPSQLTAAISAADIATSGIVTVTSFNPAPGGGASNGLNFSISATANPVPTITNLSPTAAPAGSAALTLIVNGTNFVAGSVVRWNGANRSSTFVSGTQLSAAIPASDLSATGTVPVIVFSPAPGGGVSNAQTFTINAVNTPSISRISPTQGSTAGGNRMDVYGTNLSSNVTVTIGGQNATVLSALSDGSRISVTVPAGATGAANVTVSSAAGGSLTLTGGYVYVNPQVILFADDFNFGSLGNWTASPLGLFANWNSSQDLVDYNGGGHTQIYAGNPGWTNYSVEAKFQIFSTLNYPGGLRGRVNTSTGQSYAAWLYPATQQIKLWRTAGWSVDTTGLALLQTVSVGNMAPNVFHRLRLVFNGTQITVIYDGTTVITVNDSTLGSGPVALDVSNQHIQFEDVWVTSTDPTLAFVSGIAVAPSSFVLTTGGTQQVTVTATSSDGTQRFVTTDPSTSYTSTNTAVATVNSSGLVSPVANGTATITASYGGSSATAAATVNLSAPVISRVSPTQGTTAGGNRMDLYGTNLSANVTVTIGGQNAPVVSALPAGTRITVTVPSGTTGSADIIVTNTSGSNTLSAGYMYVSPQAILFADDFNLGSLANWTASPLGLFGNWAAGQDVADYNGGGHTQIYAGNAGWTNYSVEAKFQIFSTANYPGGIRGRVNTNTGQSYAVWLYPATQQAALMRTAGWNVDAPGLVVLQNATVGNMAPNIFHRLRLVFSGSQISVMYDGATLMTVNDTALTGGAVALDVSNQHIQFDDIFVSTP